MSNAIKQFRGGVSFFFRSFPSLLLFLVLFCAQAKASCPSDLPSDYAESWVDGGCYTTSLTFNGNTCPVKVCYCYRIHYSSPGVIAVVDYYIKSVSWKSSCFGTPYPSWADIVHSAGEKIIMDDPVGVVYPPCNSSPAFYDTRFFIGHCANTTALTEDPDHYDYSTFDCAAGIGYCYEHWRLCMNNGVLTETFYDHGTWGYNGQTCESPCVDVCIGY